MVSVAEFVEQIKGYIKDGKIDPKISYDNFLLLLKDNILDNRVFDDMIRLFPHWVDDKIIANKVSVYCIASLPYEWISTILRYRKFNDEDWAYMIRYMKDDNLEDFLVHFNECLTKDVIKKYLRDNTKKSTIFTLSKHFDFNEIRLSDGYYAESIDSLMDLGVEIGDADQLCDNLAIWLTINYDEELIDKLIQYGIDGAQLAKSVHRNNCPFLNIANVLVEMGYGDDLLS